MNTHIDDEPTIEQLRELFEQVKQQIQSEQKAKGGRHRNSFKQKAVARETIRRVELERKVSELNARVSTIEWEHDFE